jgi:hypothetical protein
VVAAGADLSIPQQAQQLVSSLTTIMWATFVPMGCLGALLSYLRLRYFMVTVLNRFK